MRPSRPCCYGVMKWDLKNGDPSGVQVSVEEKGMREGSCSIGDRPL